MSTVEAGAAQRGNTTIGPAVVGKIARQVVDQAHGVHTMRSVNTRRILNTQGRNAVSVDPVRNATSLDLEIAVEYPLPVRDTTQALRDALTERIESSTGLRMSEVNITVSEFRLVAG